MERKPQPEDLVRPAMMGTSDQSCQLSPIRGRLVAALSTAEGTRWTPALKGQVRNSFLCPVVIGCIVSFGLIATFSSLSLRDSPLLKGHICWCSQPSKDAYGAEFWHLPRITLGVGPGSDLGCFARGLSLASFSRGTLSSPGLVLNIGDEKHQKRHTVRLGL